MTIKCTKDELKLITKHIEPYLIQDPDLLENKEAIFVYILYEIAKKIGNTFLNDPNKSTYKFTFRHYQVRAFKELLDRLDFMEIGERDPWQYAVLSQIYEKFPQELKLLNH